MVRTVALALVLVLAHAAQGCGSSSGFSVGDSGLVVTSTSLPLGTSGQAYSTTLTAAGGRPVYSWSLVSGTLPQGLTLAANGTISGTPTTAGDLGRFTVRVEDMDSFVAERALVLGITKEVSITTTSPLPAATFGAPYSQRLDAAGGNPPYTWAVQSGTSFPPGFSLNRLTGDVIAVPTLRGTFNLSVVVTDTRDERGVGTATETFQVTVN